MTRARARQLRRFTELPVAETARRQALRLVSLAARLVRSSGPVPGWAVVSAALSPIVITGGWLIADALQPATYSPIHKTVSVLAGHAGTDRWIMTSALFLVGGCHFVTAAGLTGVRRPARILLVVAGLSSVGIAASPEPVAGSTPQHLAWTSLGAVTIAVWPAFTGRRGSRPLILSIPGAAVVTTVFIALLAWLVIETQGGSVLGLAERMTSSIQTTWPFAVALALRTPPRTPPAGQPGQQPQPHNRRSTTRSTRAVITGLRDRKRRMPTPGPAPDRLATRCAGTTCRKGPEFDPPAGEPVLRAAPRPPALPGTSKRSALRAFAVMNRR
jgi:Protein of unknown function (DUF998)